MAEEHDRREDAARGPTDPPGGALARRKVGLDRPGGLIDRGLGLAVELAGGGLVPSASPRVATMSCGWTHALAVGDDGSLWAWGANHHAELGLGDRSEALSPTRVGDSGWAAVSAHGECSLGLKQDGSLWRWGPGPETGPTDISRLYQTTPGQVGSERDWRAISAGRGHCLGLKRDGSLWSWGSRNHYGELGHDGVPDFGSLTDAEEAAFWTARRAAERVGIYNFCPVGEARDWAAISAGLGLSLALKTDGSLCAWGGRVDGQGARGILTRRLGPLRVGEDRDWAAVSTFCLDGIALKLDGTMWTWGGNRGYELGYEGCASTAWPTRIDTASDWAAVSAGARHSLGVKSDGSLWGWGDNSVGQLGLGDTRQVGRPTRIGDDGDWAAVSSGWDASLALKRDGSLWSWGKNDWSGISLGERGARLVPTRACILTGRSGPSVSTGPRS